ncbi:MAG TPA: hypothetical protein PLF98_06265, partial [Thermotogota bacterium]|nr:hypothetical protein [Thermotogota bacterium]
TVPVIQPNRSREGFSLLLELLIGVALSFFCFALVCTWFERNGRIEIGRKRIQEARDSLLLQRALLENGHPASENDPVRQYILGNDTVLEIFEIPLPEEGRYLEWGRIRQKESGE